MQVFYFIPFSKYGKDIVIKNIHEKGKVNGMGGRKQKKAKESAQSERKRDRIMARKNHHKITTKERPPLKQQTNKQVNNRNK